LEANQAQKWVKEGNELELKAFLKKVGSNRFLRAQILTVIFKNHWNLLAKTTVANCNTSDVSEQSSNWWSRGESNP
jgi:hypothetical protein